MAREASVTRTLARGLVVGFAAVAVVHALAGISLLLLQRGSGEAVLAHVTVEGRDVGGLEREQLNSRIQELADAQGLAEVQVTAGEAWLRAQRSELGVEFDVDAAADAAWVPGRRGFWSALRDHFDARRGVPTAIELDWRLEEGHLEQWAGAAAAELSREPRSAEISIELGDSSDPLAIEVVEPQTGQHVAPEDVAAAVRDAVFAPESPHIEVAVQRTVAPAVTARDLAAVEEHATRAIAAPVTLANPSSGADLILPPAQIARLLDVVRDEDAPEGERLALTIDPDRLDEMLADVWLEGITVRPVAESISVTDDGVVVEGEVTGFLPDLTAMGAMLLELTAQPAPRRAELPGRVPDADDVREELEQLGIREQISSFTTPLTPGQSRNQNIQQAAREIDGTLILPGERFSLNEGIGRRTPDRGFVENGFIRQGDLVSVVGGGVSQMGTTVMNAAWFAGVELVDFTPHSLYFTHYPMGREATISWATIDLVFENDSPYAIWIASSASDREVSVSFWSTPWAQVETWTGEPYNRTSGELRDGFTVDFGRTITYPDGSSRTENYTHRYLPENEPDD